MNTLQLFFFSSTGLILLIIHSYYKRGFRLTFNFFLLSFIAGMRKEAGTFLGTPISKMKYPTPFVHPHDYPLVFSVVNTTVGWMLAFYLSWCIAEKITAKLPYFKGKILPTLFFSGLVVAALSYAIEATAINIGWWKWVFFDKHFSDYFVGGVHLFALSAWFYFAVHFLAPFLLIECSNFRKADWKCLFFLIPFLRTCTMIFLGSDLPRMLYEFIFFILLTALMISNPLDFNYPEFQARIIKRRFIVKLIRAFPLIVSLLILLVLIYVDLVKVGDGSLLISLLPLILLIMLSLRLLSPWFVALSIAILVLVFGKVAIPALIPVLVFLFLSVLGKFLNMQQKTATRHILL